MNAEISTRDLLGLNAPIVIIRSSWRTAAEGDGSVRVAIAKRWSSSAIISRKLIRNTFSLEKLKYSAGDASVIYRSKMTHGRNKRNFQVFLPLEFIASITQHIPEPSFQLVRYYGWYSNRMRRDRKKQEEREGGDETIECSNIIDIRNYRPVNIPQLMWRECIKKVWEVDPLTCPKCDGEMRIISFIFKQTVIKKILTHLNIYEEKKNPRAPPRFAPKYTEPEITHYDDGWPVYDELVFDFFKNSMTANGCVCTKLDGRVVWRQIFNISCCEIP